MSSFCRVHQNAANVHLATLEMGSFAYGQQVQRLNVIIPARVIHWQPVCKRHSEFHARAHRSITATGTDRLDVLHLTKHQIRAHQTHVSMVEFVQLMVHSAIVVRAQLAPHHHDVGQQQMLVIRIHAKMVALVHRQALAVTVACVRHAKPDGIVSSKLVPVEAF